jgi:predicted metal-binding membrane protein
MATADIGSARGMTRGAVPLTPSVLLVIGAAAGWQTVADAGRMCCMLDGLARAGRAMAFDTGPVRFVVMWTVMMAAMMLPGIVPVVAGRRLSAGAAVATAYLAVWASTAVVAFAVLIALSGVSQPTVGLDRIGGTVLALAGAYQFTSRKRRMLASFRDETAYAPGAFGAGLSHGLRCLGSSWALMSLLLVVGVMNLVWMAAIGAICFGEKVLTGRARLAATAVIGVTLVALGLATVIYPPALTVIAGRIGLAHGPMANPMG